MRKVTILNPLHSEDKTNWFSNLFKCATVSMNISSKGPITVSTTPYQAFERDVIENLGLRAILSTGIGDHTYHDRIFSARITLPRVEQSLYEALIFNFVVREDAEKISLKMNSKALTLLIFIYPKKFRQYINRFEEELELMLSESDILPQDASELLDQETLNQFLNDLHRTIIHFENQSLLGLDQFTIDQVYSEENLRITSEIFVEDMI